MINKNNYIHKSAAQEIGQTLKYNCIHNRLSYYIKFNLTKNHHSKIHNDKAIISCKKWM